METGDGSKLTDVEEKIPFRTDNDWNMADIRETSLQQEIGERSRSTRVVTFIYL